jgi:hypothetical protein
MGALTFGKSEAISVTAEWIFSEHGTKLGGDRERGLAVTSTVGVTGRFMYSAALERLSKHITPCSNA